MRSEKLQRQADEKKSADPKKRPPKMRDLPPLTDPKGGNGGSVFQKGPPLPIPPQGFINRSENGNGK